MPGFVSQGGGGGFVDDPHHLQPGDLARLAGGLALCIGKIGRHGDDGFVDGLVGVAFCDGL